MLSYQTVYGRPIFGPDKKFIRFDIDESRQSAKEHGYWRFFSDGQGGDDARAYSLGFQNPEQVLTAVGQGDGRYNNIQLAWIPGSKDSFPYRRTGTALQHIRAIAEEHNLLGIRQPWAGQIALYPVDEERRLLSHRQTLDLRPWPSQALSERPGDTATNLIEYASPFGARESPQLMTNSLTSSPESKQDKQSQTSPTGSSSKSASIQLAHKHVSTKKSLSGAKQSNTTVQTRVSGNPRPVQAIPPTTGGKATNGPFQSNGDGTQIAYLQNPATAQVRPPIIPKMPAYTTQPTRPYVSPYGPAQELVGVAQGRLEAPSAPPSADRARKAYVSPYGPPQISSGKLADKSKAPTPASGTTPKTSEVPHHQIPIASGAQASSKISDVSEIKRGPDRDDKERAHKRKSPEFVDLTKDTNDYAPLREVHRRLLPTFPDETSLRKDKVENKLPIMTHVGDGAVSVTPQGQTKLAGLAVDNETTTKVKDTNNSTTSFQSIPNTEMVYENGHFKYVPIAEPSGGEHYAPNLDDIVAQTLPLSETWPCFFCGGTKNHNYDCYLENLPPMKPLNKLQLEALAKEIKEADPERWRLHRDPPSTEPTETAEEKIAGMAELIRSWDIYRDDPSLHCLPDSTLCMMWAMKTSPNIQFQMLTPDGEIYSSELDHLWDEDGTKN